jgi:signal transduction histidine kinase
MDIRPRILICDDEPLMTESIKAVLVGTGTYRIQTTNSARHALTLIRDASPDLVILDVMMPELTGFELLDAVDRNRCDASFILITGETSVDSVIKAIRKGASDYLRKPFEPDELTMRVEKVLSQRRIKHEHLCAEAEKRQLQHQLRQAHKMEAIGTLAGGIAHDFNNILSIILGNTELALMDLPADLPAQQNLNQILTASMRAREMIQQLLSFSRQEESGCKPLRLNRVVNESLNLMRASLPTNISIERDISEIECITIAEATQIHQVMLNLCTNAAHAMEPDGGRLTIRLEPVTLDVATAVAINGLCPGDYVKMIVADTGHGIARDIIDRIFDPYFTTKATGKGTGMGLSVVHGIVKSIGGAIEAVSQPGRSTEFRIYLPRVDMAMDTEPAVFQQRQLPGGHEHIMIVDDEEMLMDMMRQVLEQLGYAVSAYVDSGAALDAFLANPTDYDLLITDMAMPGMTGINLAKAVKAERDDLPIILCTGYNEQISQQNTQSMGIQTLIMKPVGMQRLAQTIRDVLMPVTTERRKHPRYKAPADAFVISDATPEERCQLLDISIAGLAYCHGKETATGRPLDQLSIIAPDGQISISGLHCRTVSDIPSGNGVSLPDTGQTRRSVCFEDLTSLQTEWVNRFIQRHTKGLKP